MDETAIRLDELGEVYRLLCRGRGSPSEDTLRTLVERATALIAPDNTDLLERKILGVVGMAGKIAESQVGWILTPEARVIDIRAGIDRLLRAGQLVRVGLVDLGLGQGSSASISSSVSKSG